MVASSLCCKRWGLATVAVRSAAAHALCFFRGHVIGGALRSDVITTTYSLVPGLTSDSMPQRPASRLARNMVQWLWAYQKSRPDGTSGLSA